MAEYCGKFATKDSGKRCEFKTGSRREPEDNKGFYDCLPFNAIDRLARLMERGAAKYSKHQWRRGLPLSRYLSSALRHLCQFANGQVDEDHLAAVLFNVSCLMETERAIARGLLPKELDDLWFNQDEIPRSDKHTEDGPQC